MDWYGGFAPYVTVAERKRKAAKEVERLKKKGQICQPIVLSGRSIVNTFWGKAWCTHLESYSDYSNRLPRGRTYVRHGSVIDLQMAKGEITALVSGSSIYKVKIVIGKVITTKWNKIVSECAGKIDSLIELLQGKFSKAVMQIITDPEKGLFPHPKEIKLSCSCPDWADMCKHVAAVLYGVGARLDDKPEELFMLRQADHVELIAQAGAASFTKTSTDQSDQILTDSDLSSLFGIEMGDRSQKNTDLIKAVSKLKKRRMSLGNSNKSKTKLVKATKTNKKMSKKKISGKWKVTNTKIRAKTKKASPKSKRKKPVKKMGKTKNKIINPDQ